MEENESLISRQGSDQKKVPAVSDNESHSLFPIKLTPKVINNAQHPVKLHYAMFFNIPEDYEDISYGNGAFVHTCLKLHFYRDGGAFGFFTGSLKGFVTGDGNAHAAFAFYLRFTEEAQLGVGLGKGFIQVTKANLFAVALNKNDGTGTGAVLNDVGDGQAEDSAGVQSEL